METLARLRDQMQVEGLRRVGVFHGRSDIMSSDIFGNHMTSQNPHATTPDWAELNLLELANHKWGDFPVGHLKEVLGCVPGININALGYHVSLDSGYGFDPRAKKIDCTPLMRAAYNGLNQMVHILLHHGADVHIKDELGRTALHYALKRNSGASSSSVVRQLIQAGADIEAQMKDGATPLAYGLMQADQLKSKHNAAWEVLLEHGASTQALVWGMWEDWEIRDQHKKMTIAEFVANDVKAQADEDGYSPGVMSYINAAHTKMVLQQATQSETEKSVIKRQSKV